MTIQPYTPLDNGACSCNTVPDIYYFICHYWLSSYTHPAYHTIIGPVSRSNNTAPVIFQFHCVNWLCYCNPLYTT